MENIRLNEIVMVTPTPPAITFALTLEDLESGIGGDELTGEGELIY
jgi:hypothetical protein